MWDRYLEFELRQAKNGGSLASLAKVRYCASLAGCHSQNIEISAFCLRLRSAVAGPMLDFTACGVFMAACTAGKCLGSLPLVTPAVRLAACPGVFCLVPLPMMHRGAAAIALNPWCWVLRRFGFLGKEPAAVQSSRSAGDRPHSASHGGCLRHGCCTPWEFSGVHAAVLVTAHGPNPKPQ